MSATRIGALALALTLLAPAPVLAADTPTPNTGGVYLEKLGTITKALGIPDSDPDIDLKVSLMTVRLENGHGFEEWPESVPVPGINCVEHGGYKSRPIIVNWYPVVRNPDGTLMTIEAIKAHGLRKTRCLIVTGVDWGYLGTSIGANFLVAATPVAGTFVAAGQGKPEELEGKKAMALTALGASAGVWVLQSLAVGFNSFSFSAAPHIVEDKSTTRAPE